MSSKDEKTKNNSKNNGLIAATVFAAISAVFGGVAIANPDPKVVQGLLSGFSIFLGLLSVGIYINPE